METLHVTDLDGTLLSSAGSMSDYAVETINEMIDLDELNLTYATARSFHSASAATALCHFKLPVIVYGGAFLIDPVSLEPVQSNCLEADIVDEIISVCRRHGLPPLIYRIENGRDLVSWVHGEESEGIRNYLADRRHDPRLSPVSAWSNLSAREPFYVSVIGDHDSIHQLAHIIEELTAASVTINVQDDTYHPCETWLEVTAKQANKATAVTTLRASLGARRLVCFGDNINDLAMFAVADQSLAVANAVDAVKMAATTTLLSNDQDGVVQWLATHHSTTTHAPSTNRKESQPHGPQEGPSRGTLIGQP